MKYKLLKNKNEVNVRLYPVEVGHVCNVFAHKSNSGKQSYSFDFGGCSEPSKKLDHVTKCDLCVNRSINDTGIFEKYFEKVK